MRDDREGPRQTMRGNVAVHNILSDGTNARWVQARRRAHVTWRDVKTQVLQKSNFF